MSRRRGLTMLEAVTGLTLAVGLVLATTPLLLQDMRALGAARGELRAREALQSAKERVQSGALALPADLSAAPALPSDVPGISLVAEPVADVDPRVSGLGGLRAARLVATWADEQGQAQARALVVLLPGGRP